MLLRNAPGKLVFPEPDIFARGDVPTFMGPMDFPNLVFNVHVYCGYRNPVTGNPTNVGACLHEEARAVDRRAEDRAEMASHAQRDGPAWFVSEFGATSNPTYLRQAVALMDAHLVGWTYWSWKYYDDPTGSTDEALVKITGRLRPTARVLAQTYAAAIDGVPTSMRYSHGYCVKVTGGRVLSPTDSGLLAIGSGRKVRSVTVVVTAARTDKIVDGRRTPVCAGTGGAP